MLETIVLLLLAPLAAIGTVTLGNITGSYTFKKEEKRKEKLKEEENAEV
ncbi:hypothetical protein POD66_002434 [Enterococcus hirae]|nr:hypothetical protein [Enterococcus hirae]